MDYKEYNDFELIDYIRENNEEANEIIFKKYEPLITSLAKKMHTNSSNCGIDINDLVQEGMLGLSNAINNFDQSKDVMFYTYAKTCIERKMISFVISAKRLKHKILNESLSLEQADDDGNFNTLEYLLSDNKDNPEVLLMSIENQNEILKLTNDILTDFEKQVFELKINDFDYKEIANILDRDAKSIDNALQRIRLKIKNNIINK